jgi:PAS domain S-box-containing protein
MTTAPSADLPGCNPTLHFLDGDGEMRKRIREFDWASTELGPPVQWPKTLRTAVAIMLDCASPAYIAWGPRFIQLYNDAYIPIFGDMKHPAALGRTTMESWHEIWDFVGLQFNKVMASRAAVRMKNQKLLMQRSGFVEEAYFSFSYSPLTDGAGRVLGVLALPWETTVEVVNHRRTETMRKLTAGLAKATQRQDILSALEEGVAEAPEDLLFGLCYGRQSAHEPFELIAAAGLERGSDLAPLWIEPGDASAYGALAQAGTPVITECSLQIEALCRADLAPAKKGTCRVAFQPLFYTSYRHADAFLVLGLNPMRPHDDAYESFVREIGTHIETAVRRVQQDELEERERQHHYKTLMAALPCMVWISDVEAKAIFLNERWLEFTGNPLEAELDLGWIEHVHPDDHPLMEKYRGKTHAHQRFSFEFRLKDAQGRYRWLLNEAIPRYDTCGAFAGYISTCLDITDRKNAEQEILSAQQELRVLYEHLEVVRTEERYALAREVHDQLGQILSAAKIDIKLLEEGCRHASASLPRRKILKELDSAGKTIDKAILVVRELALELRPPELESQGLAAAIEWHARDFERRTRIGCSVRLPGEMCELADAAAVTLFRIFQEAMTNTLRHAKATRIVIHLKCRPERITLRVLDDGIGISNAQRAGEGSLGLKGMRERAALAGGKLLLGRARACGTLVSATLPLKGNTPPPALNPPRRGQNAGDRA